MVEGTVAEKRESIGMYGKSLFGRNPV